MEEMKSFCSLSPQQVTAVRRFVKRSFEENHYRIIFVSYTLVVTMISSCLIYAIQHSQEDVPVTTFFACWFQAISCVTCTGLSIAKIPQWHVSSLVVIIVTIECGSIVLCSAIPSILRIRRLRKIHHRPRDDRNLVRRHLHVNIAIVWTCVMYWLVTHVMVFILFVGQKGAWWSIFHLSAALSSAGISLSPTNFATPELAGDTYLVIVMIVIMPMGNTLLPVWLQLSVRGWRALLWKIAAHFPSEQYTPHLFLMNLSTKEMGDAINELILRPSAYYTHLFRPKQTLVLFLMWFALTAVDYLMFIPEYNTDAFVSTRHQWLQALFQTVTVRTTGFTIMNFSEIELGHLSYWILAMYLSSYPFIITESTARTLQEDVDEDYDFPEAVEPPPPQSPAGADNAMATLDHSSEPQNRAEPIDEYVRDEQRKNSSLLTKTISLLEKSDGTAHEPCGQTPVDSSLMSSRRNNSTIMAQGHTTRLTRQTLREFYERPSSHLARRRPFSNEPDVQSQSTEVSARRDDEVLHIALPENNIAVSSHADNASSAAFVSRGVKTALRNIQTQAGSTVAQEIGWLYLCCIIICYIEGFGLSTSAETSPLARLLFEVASAYGTVGLSISSGSASDVSFSYVLKVESQIIICVLMYFGKFRGLPQTIELDAVQHLLQRRDSQLIQRGVRFATEPDERRLWDGVRGATPVMGPHDGGDDDDALSERAVGADAVSNND
ncbi:cation transporter, putative [Bodo saltans]|uniref:Cation transporter, putative n=1 Tax=Bodo saltans TaxID=75058 RepID=A0A0S4JSW8_BODSA|nr:cation transporter, putative [Bodo saltans]|eukprot:CUG92498.1 cation transporter, putative [Bodo saltans]